MFNFRILVWNAGYKEGSYLKSINRALFGGSPGHAAAELVIPVSDENRQLIKEVNQHGKLLVGETTTRIGHAIDASPFYQSIEVPCFKIYFSFCGDASTEKTFEKHRMLDFIKDRIEEGEGIPHPCATKEQKIVGTLEKKWHGLLGSVKGSPGIEYIQHLAGLSDAQIKDSQIKMNKLKSIEQKKELLLLHVKEISRQLRKLKTEEKKQGYISSDRVKTILAYHGVGSIEDLKSKLSGMSAEMSHLRQELTTLGVNFGANPDEIIDFAVDPDLQQAFGLNYRAILKKMGQIANGVVPYHLLKMNCSTTTISVIKAGVDPELRDKLKKSGYGLPSSNRFFETPQSAFNFALKLSSTLSEAKSSMKASDTELVAGSKKWRRAISCM